MPALIDPTLRPLATSAEIAAENAYWLDRDLADMVLFQQLQDELEYELEHSGSLAIFQRAERL